MPRNVLTPADPMDSLAAMLLYRMPEVTDVRRQDTGAGVMYWVAGDTFSDEALRQVNRIEDTLFSRFPQSKVLLEVVDHHGEPPLRSAFWESLEVVNPSINISTAPSNASRS